MAPSGKVYAFQGVAGAYSEAAVLAFRGSGVATMPCETFEAVFDAVEQVGAFGFLPIENSLAGSIHRNYDLLLEREARIVGEFSFRVRHCLMALEGVPLEAVRRVHSHPQALDQCRRSLSRLGLEPVSEYDTAGSARLIREREDRQAAAIASRRAAEVYGLAVLAEGLEDNPENYTRFLLLSAGETGRPEGASKTSLAFSLRNKPAALFEALRPFAERGIDLTKIESRPIQGRPWEYMYYIDFLGSPDQAPGRAALEDLKSQALSLHLLGVYPRHPAP